jgi:general secretion pathway protein K
MPGFTPSTVALAPGQCRHGRRRGIALIAVLWLIALIGALALAILAIEKTDHLTAHAAIDGLAAEGQGDAGVFLAIHKLCDLRTVGQIPIDGQAIHFTIADQPVSVSVQDEFGKIDVNFAPQEILQSLFAAAGLSADDSKTIAQKIDDRRTATFGHVADQITAGSGVTAQFPFRTIEELKSIPGITDELFDRVRPALTVYSQQPMVQTATAPPEVLAALPGIDAQKIDDILAARRDHPVTAANIGFAEASGQQGAAGRSFTIISRAQSGQAALARRAAVLITGDVHRPYRLLEWTAVAP